MKYLLTFCSNDQDPREELLPARERYQSKFMQQVIEEGERTNTPVLILSGKFGILTPDTEIPHYDHLLLEEEVDDKVAEVIVQLEKLGVDDIEAYIKKGREVEGWNPYYEVLERAARAIDAKLEYAELPEASEPRSEITRLH